MDGNGLVGVGFGEIIGITQMGRNVETVYGVRKVQGVT